MEHEAFLATVIFTAAAWSAPAVLAQVVADSACPKYAVDIAAFATCDGDKVAKGERDASTLSKVPAIPMQGLAERSGLLTAGSKPPLASTVRSPLKPRPAATTEERTK